MQTLAVLDQVRLIPVLELEPWHYATSERPSPSGSLREVAQAWDRYWHAALADAGIVGLTPLRPGSWHVPTSGLQDPTILDRILAATVKAWDGPESLTGPDSNPGFNGGMALCQGNEVLVEPGCCADLGNISDWRDSAAYRGAEWQMLWIGHPWLSVRYDNRWLVLSETHESDAPVARWLVNPEDLDVAVARAHAELADFAVRLEPAVSAVVGNEDGQRIARKLAGLRKG